MTRSAWDAGDRGLLRRARPRRHRRRRPRPGPAGRREGRPRRWPVTPDHPRPGRAPRLGDRGRGRPRRLRRGRASWSSRRPRCGGSDSPDSGFEARRWRSSHLNRRSLASTDCCTGRGILCTQARPRAQFVNRSGLVPVGVLRLGCWPGRRDLDSPRRVGAMSSCRHCLMGVRRQIRSPQGTGRGADMSDAEIHRYGSGSSAPDMPPLMPTSPHAGRPIPSATSRSRSP